MNNQTESLKALWEKDRVPLSSPLNIENMFTFEKKHNLLLPSDLKQYFIEINGTNENYDNSFFRFNSLNQFKSLKNEYYDWKGVPDYNSALNIFPYTDSTFVFADYMFHLSSYSIRLHKNASPENEIYLFAGSQYKLIAKSFTQFIELYLNQSEQIFI